MGQLLTSLPGLVPEGPLHPALAWPSIVVGVSFAVVAGRSSGRWAASVAAGVAVVFVASVDPGPIAVAVDRPDRIAVLVTLALVGIAGAVLRPGRSMATVLTLSASMGVWGVVPDTEAPLIVGCVLLGAGALAALPGWLRDTRRRVHGVLLVLPAWAAAAGSIGRPARFGTGILAGTAVACGGLAVRSAWCRLRRRQRAGTPRTVVPAATSSTTTAPAPTTAP